MTHRRQVVWFEFLAVDGDVADPAAVRLDEFFRLHEHAARAAAGVEHAALVGREHLDQELDDRARRIELAALLALGRGELGEEILIHPAEQVARLVLGIAEADRADQVDQLAQPLLVESRAVEVLRQHALERRVIALDRDHRLVDQLADRGLLGARLKEPPARLLRHPEDVESPVLVRVLGVGALRALGLELGVLGLERIRDVLQENQAEHDVLVLGRVHVAPQLVGRRPELLGQLSSGTVLGRLRLLEACCHLPNAISLAVIRAPLKARRFVPTKGETGMP